jgi:uncharacterized small protein (TIGR04563 family)
MTSRSRRGCADRRKQSLYFPSLVLAEIERQSKRLDRSLSWVVQRCVRYGMERVASMPSVDVEEEAAE